LGSLENNGSFVWAVVGGEKIYVCNSEKSSLMFLFVILVVEIQIIIVQQTKNFSLKCNQATSVYGLKMWWFYFKKYNIF
jgi:hypothetical protein